MCYVRTVPWIQDTAVPIGDPERFSVPVLIYRKKTSKYNKTSFTNLPQNISFYRMNSLFTVILRGEDKLLETFNDVFTIQQNRVLPKRILISGEPGVGKSTLLLKYAFDWAVKDPGSALRDVKLLIHLSLDGVTLDAMLGDEIVKQNLPSDTNLTGTIIEECIHRYGKEVVILLENYDESVFASKQSNDEGVHGSLSDVISFKSFKLCRVVLTTRPWKDDRFHGELFNPYAEITLGGMSAKAAYEFVNRYCHEENAEMVRRTLQTNLVNLRPMFRNPLFMAIVCEMVANDVSIQIPFTLTKLFQQLCKYLFKKYEKRSPTCPEDKPPIGLDTCLQTLGKLVSTNNCHYIEYHSEQLTRDDRDIIDLGLAIGLLSTERGGRSREESQKRVLFFHDLLREFCLACYCNYLIVTQINDHEEFYNFMKGFLDRGENPGYFRYEPLFLCGLNPHMFFEGIFKDKSLQLQHLSGSVFIISNFIQCLFETKEENLPIDDFNSVEKKCVVLNMNLVNSHSAADYFISRVRDIKVFVVFGDILASIDKPSTRQDSCSDDDSMNIFCFNNDMDFFSDLLLKCKCLTKLVLNDLHIEYDVSETCKPIQTFRKLDFISIQAMTDIQLVKFLLHFARTKFENLSNLQLLNVQSSCNSNDVDNFFRDIFSLLCNVVDRANAIDLGNVAEIKNNVLNPERLPQKKIFCLITLELRNYVGRINFQQFISNLALCPRVTQISNSEIDFKVVDISSPSSLQYLEITTSKCPIPLVQIMKFISEQYPNLEKSILTFEDSRVECGNIQRPVVIRCDLKVQLIRCEFSASASESPYFEGKVKFLFQNCTINPDSNILRFARHCNRCVLTCTENDLCFTLECREAFGKDKTHFAAKTSVKIGSGGPLNVHQVMKILTSWFPNNASLNLQFGSVFDLVALEREEDTPLHYGIQEIVFISCSDNLDINKHLTILCKHFPTISFLHCHDCNITFPDEDPRPKAHTNFKTIRLDSCKRISLPDVMTLGSCFQSVDTVFIINCEVVLNFKNNVVIDMGINNLNYIVIDYCKVPPNIKSLLSVGYPGYDVTVKQSNDPQNRTFELRKKYVVRPMRSCNFL